MTKLLSLCIVLSACNVYDPSGYLLGAPVAVTTRDQPPIYVKLPGFGSGSPSSSALHPFDRVLTDIFPAPTSWGHTNSPIQAMSLGLEVLLITAKQLQPVIVDGVSQPVLDDAPLSSPMNVAVLELGRDHGWTAIGFSVNERDLTVGELADDVIRARAGDELNSTLFGYSLPGSTYEGVEIEEQTVRLMSPTALALSADDDIHAVDMHIALYHTDLGVSPDIFTNRTLPDNPTFYFTLRPEFLTGDIPNALPRSWGCVIDTGTIYRTQWNGTSWDLPKIHRTWQDLVPDAPVGMVGVVDGLAIDSGTPMNPGERILFSLSSGSSEASGFSGPENQVLFQGPASTPPAPPRRVVVRRGGAYGSLGKQMRAGTAVGDMCTGDPWGNQTMPSPIQPLLDDFFIARRLPRGHPTAPGGGVAPTNKPELAASAYRFLDHSIPGNTKKMMRSCMSWPKHCWKARGNATVHWGTINTLQFTPGPITGISWQGSKSIAYEGTPLVFDHELPAGGYVVTGPTATGGDTTKAFAMQWLLTVDGKTMRSPILALRY